MGTAVNSVRRRVANPIEQSKGHRSQQFFFLLLMMLLGMTASAGATEQPDVTGLWKIIGDHSLLMTKDGAIPPLLPEAKAAYEQHIAARKAGDTSFDTTTKCNPPGIPRAFLISPFALVQKPDQIALLFEWNHMYKPVRLNQRHWPTNDPLFMGDTTGTWDGDTLVMETLYLSEDSLLDDALPHSDALRATQRFRLTDNGAVLEDEITIDDPKTFAAPWTTEVSFAKQPKEAEMKEDICVNRMNLEPSMHGFVPRKP